MNCTSCNTQYKLIQCNGCGQKTVYCAACLSAWRLCCPVVTCGSADVRVDDGVDEEEDEGEELDQAVAAELATHASSPSTSVQSIVPCALAAASDRVTGSPLGATANNATEDDCQDDASIGSLDDSRTLAVYYLDVGMGDSTLIVDWECGSVVLIDCGSKGNSEIAGLPSMQLVHDLVVEAADISGRDPTIDMVYFTHPDGDHYNLFPHLVGRFDEEGQLRVMQFTVGAKPASYTSGGVYREFLKNRQVTELDEAAGQQAPVAFKNFTIQVLCANLVPLHGESVTNAASLAILLVVPCEEDIVHKLLFLGDGETTVEEALLGCAAINGCLALKIGHHGSDKSCLRAFLEHVAPKFAFVSADMTWSHPYEGAMQRLAGLPSLTRTLKDDPSHTYVQGTGGSRQRNYETVVSQAEIYSNIVSIEDDTSGSQKATDASRAGDRPVLASGVRHDLTIDLVSGAVSKADSNGNEGVWENIF